MGSQHQSCSTCMSLAPSLHAQDHNVLALTVMGSGQWLTSRPGWMMMTGVTRFKTCSIACCPLASAAVSSAAAAAPLKRMICAYTAVPHAASRQRRTKIARVTACNQSHVTILAVSESQGVLPCSHWRCSTEQMDTHFQKQPLLTAAGKRCLLGPAQLLPVTELVLGTAQAQAMPWT
jgi:hypothetical protein